MIELGERSENNFILHEFIGQKTTIVATPDPTYLHRSGTIVDETMNTFTLEYTENKRTKNIIVPKHKTVFRFSLQRVKNNEDGFGKWTQVKTIEINGTALTKRPEDRIKKLAKLAKKMNKNESIGSNRS